MVTTAPVDHYRCRSNGESIAETAERALDQSPWRKERGSFGTLPIWHTSTNAGGAENGAPFLPVKFWPHQGAALTQARETSGFVRLTPPLPIPDNARMSGKIVIERLEFRGRCGVTDEERVRPQPLAIDLELDCRIDQAGRSDALVHTIDYAKIARRVVEVGTTQDSCLLETMAERFFTMLFDEFPVTRVKLWIRKLHPPMTYIAGSVGVSLERTRLDQQLLQIDPAPAPFLVQQFHRLPKGKALDVAAGSGRHALYLASHGYQVDAVDRDAERLARLASAAHTRQLPVATRTVDLELPAPHEPDLGKETYDVILVFFYLSRPLVPFLLDALKPGGMLVYETFTIDNYFHHKHPKRWDFCLAHNELLRMTSSLQILHYDEGAHEGGHGQDPVYTAQLVAQKPTGQARPA